MYQVLINGEPGPALANVEDETECCFNTILQTHWYLKEYFQIWKPRMLPLILINVPTPIEGSEVIIKKVE